jgi:hypothetical protein
VKKFLDSRSADADLAAYSDGGDGAIVYKCVGGVFADAKVLSKLGYGIYKRAIKIRVGIHNNIHFGGSESRLVGYVNNVFIHDEFSFFIYGFQVYVSGRSSFFQ